MADWRLLGPKVPQPVWSSHLLRARSYCEAKGGIVWSKLTPADWPSLDAGPEFNKRVLLIVHGTGLRTQLGFSGVDKVDFERLNEQYEGRILAFEHRSLAHRLARNSRDLATQLERCGVPLELDVLGLSRGGLVARMLIEGWETLREDIRIHKLIFIATPNDGTPCARRDPSVYDEMGAWRRDVRRLALVERDEQELEVYEDPSTIRRFDPDSVTQEVWPLLHGSADQMPGCEALAVLNGFKGPPPHQPRPTTYYALASVFNFDHGAPNEQVLREGCRGDVADAAFTKAPNDLVVPTASVFQPKQGPDACGRFPLDSQRLMVLRPSCNSTHLGLLHLAGVRRRMLSWLGA